MSRRSPPPETDTDPPEEARRVSPLPLRPTLPDPQPSEFLGWVLLGIVGVILGSATLWILWAVEQSPGPIVLSSSVPVQTAAAFVEPPAPTTVSALPTASASAPRPPRRPAKRSKPSEIRDPWGDR